MVWGKKLETCHYILAVFPSCPGDVWVVENGCIHAGFCFTQRKIEEQKKFITFEIKFYQNAQGEFKDFDQSKTKRKKQNQPFLKFQLIFPYPCVTYAHIFHTCKKKSLFHFNLVNMTIFVKQAIKGDFNFL